MCIIVDANRLSTFANPDHSDAQPIHRWVRRGGGKIVYCDEGKFASEMTGAARVRLREYSRAGMAEFFPSQSFEADLAALGKIHTQSDDPHVLALARATGTRLLYTGDRKLIDDFKNPQVINRPRGKIYSTAANSDLLERAGCPAR